MALILDIGPSILIGTQNAALVPMDAVDRTKAVNESRVICQDGRPNLVIEVKVNMVGTKPLVDRV